MHRIYVKIDKFIKNNNITFRTNTYKLCKQKGWHLIPYSKYGKDILSLIKISNEGFSVFDGKRYYIMYNPYLGNDGRTNFTIAHEIGHIVLDHHRETNQQILMYNGSSYIENQANIFARNILMPAKTTYELMGIKTINELADIFEVSPEMTKIRIQYLKTDLKYYKKLKEVNHGTI